MTVPRPTLILSPLSRAGMRHDDNARFIYSELPQAFADAGSVCDVFPFNGMDQAQARAEMLAAFKKSTEYEDALFIDGDICTSAAFVLKMARLQEPLLSVCYEDRQPEPGRTPDGGTQFFVLDTAGEVLQPEVREGMRMLRLRGNGLGLTRIRRSVVDRLWQWAREGGGLLYQTPFWTSHLPGLMGLEVCGLFEPISHEHPDGSGIDRRRPEDMSFFARCIEAGITPYAPLEIPLIHAGKGGRSLWDAMLEQERLRSARKRRVAFELSVCPENLAEGTAHVLDGGYAIPGLTLSPGDRVLDIGANIGAFAVWAMREFPGVAVHSFEPNPAAFDMLQKNLAGRGVELHEMAVTGTEATRATLYPGRNNDGEATIHPIAGLHHEHGIEVSAMPARKLPPCALLKIDTEGAELEILTHYPHLGSCQAVMVEWHNFDDYRAIGKLLVSRGFLPVLDRTRGQPGPDRELCFVRKGSSAIVKDGRATEALGGAAAARNGFAAEHHGGAS